MKASSSSTPPPSPTIHLLIPSSAGIHLPFFFASTCSPSLWSIDELSTSVLLSGPSDPHYWDTWEHVLNSASFTSPDGFTWTLHHDDDLFAVRSDHEFPL